MKSLQPLWGWVIWSRINHCFDMEHCLDMEPGCQYRVTIYPSEEAAKRAAIHQGRMLVTDVIRVPLKRRKV